MKKRFSEEQIIGFVRETDKGMAVKELWSSAITEALAKRGIENPCRELSVSTRDAAQLGSMFYLLKCLYRGAASASSLLLEAYRADSAVPSLCRF